MRPLSALALCVSLVVFLGSIGSTAQANDASAPQTAACTSSVGPGIPPPASVGSGNPGFHAAWYGQSGYMTLCPGDAMTATVAMYNSGSRGWVRGVLGQVGYLGTWNPVPGQDQPSALGGDGQLGSPNTGWPRYNRVAIQPADYVGPNQVAWFQFGIRAPQTPGTYDLYIRPLIEGAQWMEDYGIFWRITVPGVTPVGAPAKLGCTASPATIVSGSTQTSTITVSVLDGNGLNVTTDNGRSITLSQAGATSSLDGGATGNSSTRTTVNGNATFTLAAPPAGTTGADQLSAASTNLTGCIATVAFNAAGASTSLAVTLGQNEFPTGNPHTTTATATLKDASGATTTTQTPQAVTFSVDNAGICSVSPTSTTIPAGSSSASSTLTTTGSPGSCTVTASASGLGSGSATASVTASGPPAKLVITGNTCSSTPTTAISPSSTCDVTVQVQDAGGNKVFGPTAITLGMNQPNTGSPCGAVVTGTTPPGGTGNPATSTTTVNGTTVKFTIGDGVAESCTATASSSGLTPASTTISFVGSGTATHIAASASPNPIPANGASQSTITVCVKDAANNTVPGATDSIDLAFTSSTGGTAHATTLVSFSPQVANAGCAAFIVRSTVTMATDTYTANDLTRTVPSVQVTITTN
ncbi:MAG TPA: hypothetical protein VGS17_12980 [Candidatus Limnocylindria bacterium]|nr:hypothetical protein [Candidatus Limnocylindria bacterium]